MSAEIKITEKITGSKGLVKLPQTDTAYTVDWDNPVFVSEVVHVEDEPVTLDFNDKILDKGEAYFRNVSETDVTIEIYAQLAPEYGGYAVPFATLKQGRTARLPLTEGITYLAQTLVGAGSLKYLVLEQ